MIIIVTGNRGVGKTTLLLKQIEELKNKGTHPTGIMTPAVYGKDGRKVGFFALDVTSGEQWELGRSDKRLDGPSYGPFSFSENGFVRANEILEKELTEGSSNIFLDEIGPLELKKGYGFFPVLSLVRIFDRKRNLYLVIRPELLDDFVNRYISEREYKVIEITPENRERIVFSQ